ncbi:MAG: RdgB/HAM1 family non-canonical purine NTP pyrophosphatase [Firmicutes bacterium]|nr:RdgB/HAM1 family non-canonical purine NTP pyrophosphatase [Dethiobacter sp.]MBS3887690.1 RdgB/HAM1 family non-canonical purine NTP pyrophosphatase [Bacillota bacterium]MBS4053242.1 RdgB/HAM1 family non-canonical purine NTP pyrophosphatase [Thermaerobacter sp.]
MKYIKQLVLASGNAGKLREIEGVLAPTGMTVTPITSYYPTWSVEETGQSFFANASLKAVAAMQATGLPALADDSGLAVSYLGGAPGVHSRTFAGPLATDAENNALLLKSMQRARTRRYAHFTCVLALAMPGREVQFAVGRLFGSIIEEARGEGGFGYDPLFLVRGREQTLAELSLAEKNKISHRAKALARLLSLLAPGHD